MNYANNDYYPFGMLMPGRDSVYKSSYRYGFNGKEMDNEPYGQGNEYDYGFRIYNPRIGRFLSVDPITKEYPELTPYQFASNRPIDGTDRDGLEWDLSTVKHNLQFNATLQQQLPSSQQLKMQVLQQAMMATAKRPQPQLQPAPVYSPQEQLKHDAVRIQKLSNAGYNADGTPKPLTRLAENKTWNNFSNNLALPMVTMATGEGLFKLGGAVLKPFFGDVEYAIQSAANEAKVLTGEGSGPVYGTNVHTAFKEQINLLQKQGVSVTPEVSYLNGEVVPYGTKGSVRADVVVGDINNPTAVYDLKTGGAKLTTADVTNYKANLPTSVKTIKEIKPGN